jgi:hypothetical protein
MAVSYIVLTLHNTANRDMTLDEEEELTNELLQIFAFWCYSFYTEKIKVLNQEQVEWVDERRDLEGDVGFEEIISTSVTLRLYTSYKGGYSDAEIGTAAAELLETNGEALVKVLQGRDEFPFFFSLDEIRSVPVDANTLVVITELEPVAAPKSEIQESQTSDQPANGSRGSGKCMVNVNNYYASFHMTHGKSVSSFWWYRRWSSTFLYRWDWAFLLPCSKAASSKVRTDS